MGVGKSTVGRRLAKRLGVAFVDSDSAIEDAAGYPPAEIFERYGEQDFRDGERRLVARLIEGDVRVIATGGGAYVDPRTRQLLNERAITVWLDAPWWTFSQKGHPVATPASSCAPAVPSNAGATLRRAAPFLRRGAHPREKRRRARTVVDAIVEALEQHIAGRAAGQDRRFSLRQWPVREKLVSAGAQVAGRAGAQAWRNRVGGTRAQRSISTARPRWP